MKLIVQEISRADSPVYNVEFCIPGRLQFEQSGTIGELSAAIQSCKHLTHAQADRVEGFVRVAVHNRCESLIAKFSLY